MLYFLAQAFRARLLKILPADKQQSDGQTLPAWYMVEIVRDLPRLVEEREAGRA